MDCDNCGKQLVFDLIDEEELVWCPQCGKEHNEKDEANSESSIPGTTRELRGNDIPSICRSKNGRGDGVSVHR